MKEDAESRKALLQPQPVTPTGCQTFLLSILTYPEHLLCSDFFHETHSRNPEFVLPVTMRALNIWLPSLYYFRLFRSLHLDFSFPSDSHARLGWTIVHSWSHLSYNRPENVCSRVRRNKSNTLEGAVEEGRQLFRQREKSIQFTARRAVRDTPKRDITWTNRPLPWWINSAARPAPGTDFFFSLSLSM